MNHALHLRDKYKYCIIVIVCEIVNKQRPERVVSTYDKLKVLPIPL